MSRSNISPLIKAQVEKLAAAGGGITFGRRLISSSSPIIIPTKPLHSNESSPSSSYLSAGDPVSSMGETLLPSHHDIDNAMYTSLLTLTSPMQQLEHSAARDRIAVKNKLRQPSKPKLVAVKETDDNQTELFCSMSIHELTTSLPFSEPKMQPQVIVDLTELDNARSRLRVHSADKTLSTMSVSTIQRSVSCKRPQEVKMITRSRYQASDEEDDDDDDVHNQQSVSRPPPEEHIYDNLDLFKHPTAHVPSDLSSIESQPPLHLREQSTLTRVRLRPVTVHISSHNNHPTTNEFESVFNQLKKRSIVKKELTPEPTPVESVAAFVAHVAPLEETTPIPVSNENESMVPHFTSTTKQIEISTVTQSPNRRKTVGGVHLPANNKVATTESKPALSWIDMAKQKQSRYQTVSMETHHHDESAQQLPSTVESTVLSRKQITFSANSPVMKDNTFDDIRSNRKSMFESTVTRQPSPSAAVERDSIRAMKADKPNRINNLIQLFDK